MTASSYIRPTYARHYENPPQIQEPDGVSTWITRGANMVVVITEARAGTLLAREDNSDEYMLLLPEGEGATLTSATEEHTVAGDTLSILPPGKTTIRLQSAGTVVRIFSNRAEDLADQAANADIYALPIANIAPLVAWPDPVDGFKIRSYDLGRFAKPDGPMIQPRIFRSTNLMINVFVPWHAVRDTTAMSPHWHDDFEQASLGLQGTFVHHIRYPWGGNLSDWHPDEHTEIGSPSVTIIPPPLVHTTRNVDANEARLIDVFSPPRFDFSLRPGFVLNEADYPMPAVIPENQSQAGGTLSSWQKG
ncbi:MULTISPECIES: cupin domain-containing protein [Agrobacterium]|uniref:hypothetical protein n=1 Tax=Agrobacterium tumefaciens TaxID=358 RepID=UPI000EF25100|nr:hypothetical protein At1D1108_51480 [Agrobacterium tumefaciens]NSY09887.1 hypothetical protein [Agrobacterium tumefaciens]NSY93421.1 hypothetical protein [Agrobacterium tumefaciens]